MHSTTLLFLPQHFVLKYSLLARFSILCSRVSACREAVSAVGGLGGLEGFADGVPEMLLSSGSDCSQVGFELRKDFLDQVEIGRGKRRSSAPVAVIMSFTFSPLCELRLSRMMISFPFNSGTLSCFSYP